jgi:hypothetical protein
MAESRYSLPDEWYDADSSFDRLSIGPEDAAPATTRRGRRGVRAGAARRAGLVILPSAAASMAVSLTAGRWLRRFLPRYSLR